VNGLAAIPENPIQADISVVGALLTPLCPAGHLPRKGGDQQVAQRRGFQALLIRAKDE